MRLLRNILHAAASLVLLFSGCSHIIVLKTDNLPVFTVSDNSKIDEKEFLSSIRKGNGAVFFLKAGTEFPLELEINVPAVKLKQGKNALIVEKDIYVYIAKDVMYISPDRKRWSHVYDYYGIRDLFGGGKGKMEIGFSLKGGRGPLMHMKITDR